MKNKKAQLSSFEFAQKAIFWMIMIVIVAGLIIALVIMLGNHELALTKISPQVEETILMHRFLNSDKCFAYQDVSGRIYSGIIDLNKFTNESMADCYITTSIKQINFKLQLVKAGKAVLAPKYYESPSYTTAMPVLVMDKGRIYPDTLKISVRRPV